MKGTGTVALLKLPIHTAISLDGCGSNTLRNDEDILVIRDIPIGFHLLTVKAAAVNTTNVKHDATNGAGNDSASVPVSMAMPIGLAFLFSNDAADADADADATNASTSTTTSTTARTISNVNVNFVAREYNPHTEELKAEAASDITVQNLIKAIANPNQQLDASKIIHYSNFTAVSVDVASTTATTATAVTATATATTAVTATAINNQQYQQQQDVDAQNIWTLHLTQFISRKVLDRHSLTGTGDKIIPGAYSMGEMGDDDNVNVNDNGHKDHKNHKDHKKDQQQQQQDGLSMNYKPIPTIPNDRQSKIHSHSGTRRYLASLSPSQRTAFFMDQRNVNATTTTTTTTGVNTDANANANTTSNSPRLPADALFETILNDYYNNQWEILLGEMQLSFCVFICCSCLTSLEHWRDVIYIMSCVSGDAITKNGNGEYCRFYYSFMLTVRHQLQHFDCSIFREEEFTGGNAFIPAIQRMAKTCMNTTRTGTTRKRVHAATALYDQHEAMQQVAHDLFNLTITLFDTDNDFDGDKNASINNMISSVQDNTGAACSTRLDNSREMESGDTKMDGADNDEDDDSDEDGPVIVEMQDVQASYERIAALSRSTLTLHNDSDHDHDSDRRHRVQYQFLFAAISNDEDIVMACARILDEQRDVTLVREAAAYLEDVEAKM